MKTLLLTVALTVASTASFAQTATGTAESYSQSGVFQEGDRVSNRSASAIAPSVNHTAPCVIGYSGGVAVAGVGLSHGGGNLDKDCVTREEALILTRIAEMRGSARRASILHFCTNDETMRRTLIALGWCAVR